jgi:cytochrome b561
MKPRGTAYSPAHKAIHWIMAGFILTTVPIGLTMTRLPAGNLQNRLFDLHESIGSTIFALVCVRLAVRLVRGVPEAHPALPRWRRIAAENTHRALYVLVFLLPILGWLGSSAFGATVSVYGLFDLPRPIAENRPLSDILFLFHLSGAYLLTALVALHIGAAILHGFVTRDGVVQRMLPERWTLRMSHSVRIRQ